MAQTPSLLPARFLLLIAHFITIVTCFYDRVRTLLDAVARPT